MKDHFAPEVTDRFENRYATAVLAYARSGEEEDLSQAFDLTRVALDQDLAIGDLYELHRDVQRQIDRDTALCALGPERAEEFFLDAVGVYDMTLRGNVRNIRRLREEVKERRAIEEELRETTTELAHQRDILDVEVQRRTREIEQRAEDLRETNGQLKNALREQAEFTYAVSHDLKSPNNTIDMLLGILSEDFAEDLPSEANEILERARATTQRMARLIVDILNYSQSLEKSSDHEWIEPHDLLDNIVADLEGDIRAADAKIEIGPLPRLFGSRLHMRMLFQNLISNAVKFRDLNRALTVRISGRVTGREGQVAFEIADTGIGIDAAHQEKVFGLFQRLHTHDKYPGSGLGLALCHRIVGNHHGKIGVRSKPGKGSTFHFTLEAPQ